MFSNEQYAERREVKEMMTAIEEFTVSALMLDEEQKREHKIRNKRRLSVHPLSIQTFTQDDNPHILFLIETRCPNRIQPPPFT